MLIKLHIDLKPNTPSPKTGIQHHAISLRSTPEVKRRELGEGQTDMPINHLYLGEVPSPQRFLVCIFLSVLTTTKKLNHPFIPQKLKLLHASRLRMDIVILGILPLQNGLERIHIVQQKLVLVSPWCEIEIFSQHMAPKGVLRESATR